MIDWDFVFEDGDSRPSLVYAHIFVVRLERTKKKSIPKVVSTSSTIQNNTSNVLKKALQLNSKTFGQRLFTIAPSLYGMVFSYFQTTRQQYHYYSIGGVLSLKFLKSQIKNKKLKGVLGKIEQIHSISYIFPTVWNEVSNLCVHYNIPLNISLFYSLTQGILWIIFYPEQNKFSRSFFFTGIRKWLLPYGAYSLCISIGPSILVSFLIKLKYPLVALSSGFFCIIFLQEKFFKRESESIMLANAVLEQVILKPISMLSTDILIVAGCFSVDRFLYLYCNVNLPVSIKDFRDFFIPYSINPITCAFEGKDFRLASRKIISILPLKKEYATNNKNKESTKNKKQEFQPRLQKRFLMPHYKPEIFVEPQTPFYLKKFGWPGIFRPTANYFNLSNCVISEIALTQIVRDAHFGRTEVFTGKTEILVIAGVHQRFCVDSFSQLTTGEWVLKVLPPEVIKGFNDDRLDSLLFPKKITEPDLFSDDFCFPNDSSLKFQESKTDQLEMFCKNLLHFSHRESIRFGISWEKIKLEPFSQNGETFFKVIGFKPSSGFSAREVQEFLTWRGLRKFISNGPLDQELSLVENKKPNFFLASQENIFSNTPAFTLLKQLPFISIDFSLRKPLGLIIEKPDESTLQNKKPTLDFLDLPKQENTQNFLEIGSLNSKVEADEIFHDSLDTLSLESENNELEEFYDALEEGSLNDKVTNKITQENILKQNQGLNTISTSQSVQSLEEISFINPEEFNPLRQSISDLIERDLLITDSVMLEQTTTVVLGLLCTMNLVWAMYPDFVNYCLNVDKRSTQQNKFLPVERTVNKNNFFSSTSSQLLGKSLALLSILSCVEGREFPSSFGPSSSFMPIEGNALAPSPNIDIENEAVYTIIDNTSGNYYRQVTIGLAIAVGLLGVGGGALVFAQIKKVVKARNSQGVVLTPPPLAASTSRTTLPTSSSSSVPRAPDRQRSLSQSETEQTLRSQRLQAQAPRDQGQSSSRLPSSEDWNFFRSAETFETGAETPATQGSLLESPVATPPGDGLFQPAIPRNQGMPPLPEAASEALAEVPAPIEAPKSPDPTATLVAASLDSLSLTGRRQDSSLGEEGGPSGLQSEEAAAAKETSNAALSPADNSGDTASFTVPTAEADAFVAASGSSLGLPLQETETEAISNNFIFSEQFIKEMDKFKSTKASKRLSQHTRFSKVLPLAIKRMQDLNRNIDPEVLAIVEGEIQRAFDASSNTKLNKHMVRDAIFAARYYVKEQRKGKLPIQKDSPLGRPLAQQLNELPTPICNRIYKDILNFADFDELTSDEELEYKALILLTSLFTAPAGYEPLENESLVAESSSSRLPLQEADAPSAAQADTNAADPDLSIDPDESVVEPVPSFSFILTEPKITLVERRQNIADLRQGIANLSENVKLAMENEVLKKEALKYLETLRELYRPENENEPSGSGALSQGVANDPAVLPFARSTNYPFSIGNQDKVISLTGIKAHVDNLALLTTVANNNYNLRVENHDRFIDNIKHNVKILLFEEPLQAGNQKPDSTKTIFVVLGEAPFTESAKKTLQNWISRYIKDNKLTPSNKLTTEQHHTCGVVFFLTKECDTAVGIPTGINRSLVFSNLSAVTAIHSNIGGDLKRLAEERIKNCKTVLEQGGVKSILNQDIGRLKCIDDVLSIINDNITRHHTQILAELFERLQYEPKCLFCFFCMDKLCHDIDHFAKTILTKTTLDKLETAKEIQDSYREVICTFARVCYHLRNEFKGSRTLTDKIKFQLTNVINMFTDWEVSVNKQLRANGKPELQKNKLYAWVANMETSDTENLEAMKNLLEETELGLKLQDEFTLARFDRIYRTSKAGDYENIHYKYEP